MTPRDLARQMMKGSVSAKAAAAGAACGLVIETGHPAAHLTGGLVALVTLRTRRDLNIALHEMAHAVLGHSANTVQNECEADLYADEVMLSIYGDCYLFGRILEENEHYSGMLDVEALEAFAIEQGISVNIREEIALELGACYRSSAGGNL